MWTDGDYEVIDQRRNFWLNRAFNDGDQWIRWDVATGSAALLDKFSSATEARSRTTVNKIRSRRRSLLARLIPGPLEFEVEPSGTDDPAAHRQRVQEQILESLRRQCDWEGVRVEGLGQTIDGGVAALAVEFDPGAGSILSTDPVSGRKVRFGTVKVTALSIAEFIIEPGSRSVDDARWWIRRTTLTPGQAKERYGLDKEPPADSHATMSPFQGALLRRRTGANGLTSKLVSVYVYFQRPAADGSHPGCVVHVIGDQIVQYEDEWPFPFEHLNLRVTRETPWDSDWRGSTLMSDARQIQAAYNKVRTVAQAHMDRAVNARILVGRGSLQSDTPFSDEVGEVIEYEPDVAGGKPEWMAPPGADRSLSIESQALEAELDDIFHTHGVTRGQAPGDRNSGTALALLAEKDDTPLGLMSKEQARAWSDVGAMSLMILRARLMSVDDALADPETGEPIGQKHAEKVMIVDENGKAPVQVSYTADDLDENPVVRVPLEAVTPRSHAAVQAALMELSKNYPAIFQGIKPNQMAKLFNLPLAGRMTFAALSPNERMASYENVMLQQGEPMVPEKFNDHGIHIAIHLDQQNDPSYETWDEMSKLAMERHIEIHEQLKAEIEQETAAKLMAAQQGQLPSADGSAPPAPGPMPGELPADSPVPQEMM